MERNSWSFCCRHESSSPATTQKPSTSRKRSENTCSARHPSRPTCHQPLQLSIPGLEEGKLKVTLGWSGACGCVKEHRGYSSCWHTINSSRILEHTWMTDRVCVGKVFLLLFLTEHYKPLCGIFCAARPCSLCPTWAWIPCICFKHFPPETNIHPLI